MASTLFGLFAQSIVQLQVYVEDAAIRTELLWREIESPAKSIDWKPLLTLSTFSPAMHSA